MKFYKTFILSLAIYSGLWAIPFSIINILFGLSIFLWVFLQGIFPALLTAFLGIKVKNYLVKKRSDHLKRKWVILTILSGVFISCLLSIIANYLWFDWRYLSIFQLFGASGFICSVIACLMLRKFDFTT